MLASVVVNVHPVVKVEPSYLGPALAFAGAILAVLLAWYAADRRQAKQLEAANTRMLTELNDEKKRSQEQLDHDRRLTDLTHLREVLDKAAAAYDTVAGAFTDHVVARARQAEGAAFLGKDAEEVVGKLNYELADAVREVNVQQRRLELRLKPMNPVRQGYAAVRQIVQERAAHQFLNEGVWTEDLEQADNVLYRRMQEAFAAFSDAAREAVGLVQQ